MATVPVTQAQIGGVVLSATAATAGPDEVAPGDNVVLLVVNNDAGAVTVDVTVPGNTKWGQAQPDVTSVSIPANGLAVIGPLPRELADDADNLVDVTSSTATTVDLYAIRC